MSPLQKRLAVLGLFLLDLLIGGLAWVDYGHWHLLVGRTGLWVIFICLAWPWDLLCLMFWVWIAPKARPYSAGTIWFSSFSYLGMGSDLFHLFSERSALIAISTVSTAALLVFLARVFRAGRSRQLMSFFSGEL